jgi:hypothetical protein
MAAKFPHDRRAWSVRRHSSVFPGSEWEIVNLGLIRLRVVKNRHILFACKTKQSK